MLLAAWIVRSAVVVRPIWLGLLGLALATGCSAEEVPRSREQIALSFAPVVRQAAPAVVNVYTRKEGGRSPLDPFFADPFFQFFFEDFGGPRPPQSPENSLGSGVIVDGDGLIVTNHHVIEDADEIMVVLSDRREFPARVIGADEPADLALLDIDADALPALPMGDSDRIEVGDLVLAIGNPFGIGQTVTSGIVSAVARTTPDDDSDLSFIQTDAAINPGNSGGALVTLDGALVGINTAIFTRGGGSIGIGFAIPVNLVKALIRSVRGGGEGLPRAWLGAKIQPVEPALADGLGLDRPTGVLVNEVYPDGPADRAGLSKSDVVLAIDGREVFDPRALRFRLAIGAPDRRTARLTVWRSGSQVALDLPLETPPYRPEPTVTELGGRHALAGATVANLSPGLNHDVGLDLFERGVIVLEVARGSPAERLRLRRGDLIRRIDDRPIADVAQLEQAVAEVDLPWRLEVARGGRRLAVEIH